jgi:proliferating cell nuclear antigen
MPRDAFDEYYCEGELDLGLNIEELRKVAKRGSAREKVLISAGEGRFRLTLKGKADRSFIIPLIDLEAEELPEPQVELKARAGALADVFESALKDVELVSDFVKVTADGKALTLRGASDKGETEVSLSVEEGGLLEIEAKGVVSASYSLEYLLDIMKGAEVSDTVIVEFSDGAPMKLTFPIPGGGRLTYWLAPRLEE